MSLVYKFKKEELQNGEYTLRPRIFVRLSGDKIPIEVPALIDSGSDITVIPEGIAKAVGLDMTGEKSKLYAYREANDVIRGYAIITFLGRRESVKLRVPVLIALSKEGVEDEQDIVLGIDGIFDAFNINFRKSENKIIMHKIAGGSY